MSKTSNLEIKSVEYFTREELLEHIALLEKNITALKCFNNTQYQRLLNLTSYLTEMGLSTDEINKIIKLKGENI